MSKAKILLNRLEEKNKVYDKFMDVNNSVTYNVSQSPHMENKLLVKPFFAVSFDWNDIVKEFVKINKGFRPFASEDEDLFTIDIPTNMNRDKVISVIKSVITKY
jgi:hypothetical protein